MIASVESIVERPGRGGISPLIEFVAWSAIVILVVFVFVCLSIAESLPTAALPGGMAIVVIAGIVHRRTEIPPRCVDQPEMSAGKLGVGVVVGLKNRPVAVLLGVAVFAALVKYSGDQRNLLRCGRVHELLAVALSLSVYMAGPGIIDYLRELVNTDVDVRLITSRARQSLCLVAAGSTYYLLLAWLRSAPSPDGMRDE
jgi:hypothetical protein